MNGPIDIRVYERVLEKLAVNWGKLAPYGMAAGTGVVLGGFLGRRSGIKKKSRVVKYAAASEGAKERSRQLYKQASFGQSLLLGGSMVGGALAANQFAKKYYTKAPLRKSTEAKVRKKGLRRGAIDAELAYEDARRPWREQI